MVLWPEAGRRQDGALAVRHVRAGRNGERRVAVTREADEHDAAVRPHGHGTRGVVDQVRRVADGARVVLAGGVEADHDHRLRAAVAGDDDVAGRVERHGRRAAVARGLRRRAADRRGGDAAVAERPVERAVGVVAHERHQAAARAADDDPAIGLRDHRDAVVGVGEDGALTGRAEVVAGAVESRVELPVGQCRSRHREAAESQGQSGRTGAPPTPSRDRMGHASLLEPHLTGVERCPQRARRFSIQPRSAARTHPGWSEGPLVVGMGWVGSHHPRCDPQPAPPRRCGGAGNGLTRSLPMLRVSLLGHPKEDGALPSVATHRPAWRRTGAHVRVGTLRETRSVTITA